MKLVSVYFNYHHHHHLNHLASLFTDRTVIPLNLVIAIRTCFCDKSKKAFCKCLKSEENQNLFSSTGHLSDPQNGDNNNQKSGLKINHVRLFYAQATGKFAYKLSHLTLDPIDQSESHLQQWIEFVNSLLAGKRKKKFFSYFFLVYIFLLLFMVQFSIIRLLIYTNHN